MRVVAQHWRRFAYLAALMTFMMFLSHGTQDLYPDFLKEIHHIPAPRVANIAIVYNIGAILGAILFGTLSQTLGRRKGMMAALVLCLLMIPAWAFGGSVTVVVIGSVILQMGVQGAWGVIPAHLNELSPDEVRGLMPGFAYQLGILFAAGTNTIEYAMRDKLGYGRALATFEIANIALLIAVLLLGSEQRGKSFWRA